MAGTTVRGSPRVSGGSGNVGAQRGHAPTGMEEGSLVVVLVVAFADQEGVAVVLRQDAAVFVDGGRGVGGADRKLEKEVVAQRAVRAEGVEVAVLAVGEDVAVAVDRHAVDAP